MMSPSRTEIPSTCCEYDECVKTKFETRQGEKYGTEEWWFQCTSTTKAFSDPRRKAVAEWVQIPSGIVHDDDIETPTEYWGDGARFYVGEQEMSKVRAEFEQLRTEGVMFFYKGEPVCFWPPKTTW